MVCSRTISTRFVVQSLPVTVSLRPKAEAQVLSSALGSFYMIALRDVRCLAGAGPGDNSIFVWDGGLSSPRGDSAAVGMPFQDFKDGFVERQILGHEGSAMDSGHSTVWQRQQEPIRFGVWQSTGRLPTRRQLRQSNPKRDDAAADGEACVNGFGMTHMAV